MFTPHSAAESAVATKNKISVLFHSQRKMPAVLMKFLVGIKNVIAQTKLSPLTDLNDLGCMKKAIYCLKTVIVVNGVNDQ